MSFDAIELAVLFGDVGMMLSAKTLFLRRRWTDSCYPFETFRYIHFICNRKICQERDVFNYYLSFRKLLFTYHCLPITHLYSSNMDL